MAQFEGSVQSKNAIDDAIGSSAAFSPDYQAVTITFSNLLVSVSGKNSPLVATRGVSFTLPTTENPSGLRVQMTIRGFVKTQPGTRAILIAHLGDTTTLAPLPKPPGEDFEQMLKATIPARVAVQTTLFLLAERDSSDENLAPLLTVDSLDLDISGRDAGKA